MRSVGSYRRVKRSSHAGFSDGELDRARRFHRPLHAALLLDLALALLTLAALTRLDVGLPWYAAALVLPALVELVPGVVRLPVGAWRHSHAVTWQLSRQTWGGWLADRAKALAIGAVLTVLALAPIFFTAHWLPDGWPWLLAPAAALLVLLLGALAPVLLEPVFNRFEPLEEGPLSTRLHETAASAGAPLAEILVADASRRTRGQNAYVSGLGRTRRLVLWDTLLASPHDEIAVVLAHELGHRARRHVAVLTAAGMAGAAAFVIGLRLVLPHPVPHDAAAIALAATIAELAALPPLSALSRRFERSADRFSLEVTRDPGAFARLHKRLALVNLAELEPPAWLYYWVMTHPTPPERLDST